MQSKGRAKAEWFWNMFLSDSDFWGEANPPLFKIRFCNI